jgi:hypothetical protein
LSQIACRLLGETPMAHFAHNIHDFYLDTSVFPKKRHPHMPKYIPIVCNIIYLILVLGSTSTASTSTNSADSEVDDCIQSEFFSVSPDGSPKPASRPSSEFCNLPIRSHEYCLIGAGAAGLQLGLFMKQAGHDYVILERNHSAAAFFQKFPRHRRLISINKKFTGI